MALADKALQLMVVISVLSQVGFAEQRCLQKNKMCLEHLSNGFTYCLSQEEAQEDSVSIKLLVKFESSQFSKKEQLLAKLTENYIMQELLQMQLEDCQRFNKNRLVVEAPQAFLFPHITLYKMQLRTPTQEDLDTFLSNLSQAIDSVSVADLCHLDTNLSGVNYLDVCEPEQCSIYEACITKEDLKEFALNYYTLEKMILMIAGNLDKYSVSASISKHFSNTVLSQALPFSYEKFNAQQCRLRFANYTPEPNRWLISPFKVEEPLYHTFDEIPLQEKEQKAIEKLMRCLATSSIPKLIWKQNDLQKLGRSINHVHPLKFISHIINQPILRSDLQEVHRNYFKWKGFLDGFRKRMTEEFYKGTLNELVPGFAHSVGVCPEIVDHFIEKRDWEGLVKAILY